jgi:hypothetical protein
MKPPLLCAAVSILGVDQAANEYAEQMNDALSPPCRRLESGGVCSA